MNRRIVAIAAVGAFAATAAAAQAPQGPRTFPTAGSIAIMPQAGVDFTIGGKATNAVSESIAAAGTIRVGTSTVTFNAAGTASLGEKKFTDVYELPTVLGLTGSYGLTDGGEIFGGFRYIHATAKSTTGVTYNVAGNVNGTAFTAGATSTIKPTDFEAFSMDIGYRHFFRMGAFLPYVGVHGGVLRTSAIDITETLAGVSGTARIYDPTYTPTAGLQLGVTYNLAPAAAIGLETGVRYSFGLRGQDRDLSTGFRNVNNAGERLSIPVTVTGRLAF